MYLQDSFLCNKNCSKIIFCGFWFVIYGLRPCSDECEVRKVGNFKFEAIFQLLDQRNELA